MKRIIILFFVLTFVMISRSEELHTRFLLRGDFIHYPENVEEVGPEKAIEQQVKEYLLKKGILLTDQDQVFHDVSHGMIIIRTTEEKIERIDELVDEVNPYPPNTITTFRLIYTFGKATYTNVLSAISLPDYNASATHTNKYGNHQLVQSVNLSPAVGSARDLVTHFLEYSFGLYSNNQMVISHQISTALLARIEQPIEYELCNKQGNRFHLTVSTRLKKPTEAEAQIEKHYEVQGNLTDPLSQNYKPKEVETK